MPYALVDGRTGRAVTEPELTPRSPGRARSASARTTQPHHHWAQLTIVDGVATHPGQAAGAGHGDGPDPVQGVLDDWTAGTIDEPAFLSRTGWADRWGYDFAPYRPILERARAAGMALLALNAPRELVKAVSRKASTACPPTSGAAAGPGPRRRPAPGLVRRGDGRPRRPRPRPARATPLIRTPHRPTASAPTPTHGAAPPTDGAAPAWRGAADGRRGLAHGAAPPAHGHAAPPAGPTADSIYAAQVVWDESMAEASHRWLGAGGETIVILAGNGHCHDSAIVRRLVRRGGGPAVSIRPIIDDGQGNVARALAEAHNDYLFVMSVPTAASP
ncbi:MAG: ChaN family lipoprotein [Kofleriaceae bacterium]|nr:ChaN family lipoprotein [Kofleriaceae bacterium]